MKNRLLTFCDDYHQAPASYEISQEQGLVERYRNIQLRETSELRLSNLCTEPSAGGASAVANSSQP